MTKKMLKTATLAFVTLAACNHKDAPVVGGKGGNAIVNVFPAHHGVTKNLVDFKVYVKYNTSDAPANGKYDDSLTCANADSMVSCSFSGLKNGNYYFYGYGYDTSIQQNVKGGTPYTITQQNTQTLHLAVSE